METFRGHCDAFLCTKLRYFEFLNQYFIKLVISQEKKHKLHYHFYGTLKVPISQRNIKTAFSAWILPKKFGDVEITIRTTYSFAGSWGSKTSSAVEHEETYRQYICKENNVFHNTHPLFTPEFIESSVEKYRLKDETNKQQKRVNINRRFEHFIETNKREILIKIHSQKPLWYNAKREGLLIRTILIPYITSFLFSPTYEAKASRHNVICMYINRAYYLLFQTEFNRDYIEFYIDRDEF